MTFIQGKCNGEYQLWVKKILNIAFTRKFCKCFSESKFADITPSGINYDTYLTFQTIMNEKKKKKKKKKDHFLEIHKKT